MLPIASLSRLLNVPLLLLSESDFTPLLVPATGRRTGSNMTPDKTNIARTETSCGKILEIGYEAYH